ncbi:MAG: cytochrome P450 [Myxococcales bacterium]|nr:cytochrome P450 [Myxococcales bacterium]
MATAFNPFEPDFVRDPYPTYARLRSQGAVDRVRIGPRQILALVVTAIRMQRQQGTRLRDSFRMLRQRARARRSRPGSERGPGFRARVYTVSRYAEASYVLKHPELFSSEVMGGSQVQVLNAEGDIAPTSGSLIAHDPPEHTRQRSIVSRGFTPRRISELEPQIRKNAEELFARFGDRGHCDLMEEFANPLPVSVIADLLGLDPDRRDDFKRWSTALIVGSTRPGGGGEFGGNLELFREFRSYMGEVISERRRNPQEDLISTLIHSGEGEGILEPEQVISFASLLLAAGSETTTNLIGNAVLALLRHPDQLERVQRHPELVGRLIEETLRYDSPIQLTARLAMQDSEVGGISIPRGSIVAVLLASGNRDAAQFEDSERFDIDRPTPAHLAFGLGNHFCIGASLARLEGRIALEMILTRLRGLSLRIDEVERHGSFLVRGPATLPVLFDA